MKVTCHREGLLAACQIAAAAVAPRDVKPVLRNLKAVVEEDRCTLMATDLELGIRLEVRGLKVDEPGEALLPTQKILSILREAPDEEITIEASQDRCLVKGGGAEFEMPGDDPSAFPEAPAFGEEKYHEIKAGVLRDLIRRVIFSAASSEHSRFGATTGVLLELEEDSATLVATDGRRLAWAKGQAESHGGHTTKGQMPVVPVKALHLLDRNLTEPDETVQISLRPNDALLKTERAMISTRLVEGRFPSYRQVLPTKHNARAQVTVGPFLSAVRQAAIMTDEESKRVTFTFAKNKVTLQAKGGESGRSKVETPLELEGKGVEISFDPKFLIDMLKIMEPDNVLTLDLLDSQSAAVFRQEPNYLYVVVPLVATTA
ncbi:MAG: DNA polymerase III subunit beta [Gemmataceae bacterium]